MPIDPAIPLGIRPQAPQPGPLDIYQNMMGLQQMGLMQQEHQAQLEERRAQLDARNRANAEADAMNKALQATADADGNIDVEAATGLLTKQGFGSAAETLRTKHAELVDKELTSRDKQATLFTKQIQNLQRVASAVNNDGSLNAFRTEVARTVGPTYAAGLPATYSPETFEPVKSFLDTAEQHISRQQQALAEVKDAREAKDPEKWRQTIATWGSLATDQDHLKIIKNELKQAGAPQGLLDLINSPEDAAKLGITPEQAAMHAQQQAAQALTASGQEETQRHNRQMEIDAAKRIALTGGGAIDPEAVASMTRQVMNGDLPIQSVPAAYKPAISKAVEAAGGNINKLTTQGKVMKETAETLMPLISKVQDLAGQIDQMGLMGSVGGRWRKLASGESAVSDLKGLTPDQRKTVGEFASAAGLLVTGIARAHGGARAGGSIQMIQMLEKLFDASNKDLNTFIGNLNGARDFMSAYAQMGESKPSGGGVTPPPGAKVEQWVIDPKTGKLVKGGG